MTASRKFQLPRMPPLPRRRLQPWPLLLVVVSLVAGASGWWIAQLGQAGGDSRQQRLDREVSAMRQRVDRPGGTDQDRQRLLELLVALNRRAEAIALLEPMADREPDRWTLRLMLAELRRQQHDPVAAERELRQILSRWPGQVEALQLMAPLKVERGQGAAAEAEVKAAYAAASQPALQPQALDLGLLLAELQQKIGTPAQAQSTYLELARTFPNDQRPLLGLAILLHDQGDIPAAQEALNQARLRSSDQTKPDPRLDRLAASWGLEKLRAPSRSGPAPAPKPRPSAPPGP